MCTSLGLVPVQRWHTVLYRNVYHFVVAYMWRKLWSYLHSYLNSPRIHSKHFFRMYDKISRSFSRDILSCAEKVVWCSHDKTLWKKHKNIARSHVIAIVSSAYLDHTEWSFCCRFFFLEKNVQKYIVWTEYYSCWLRCRRRGLLINFLRKAQTTINPYHARVSFVTSYFSLRKFKTVPCELQSSSFSRVRFTNNHIFILESCHLFHQVPWYYDQVQIIAVKSKQQANPRNNKALISLNIHTRRGGMRETVIIWTGAWGKRLFCVYLPRKTRISIAHGAMLIRGFIAHRYKSDYLAKRWVLNMLYEVFRLAWK